MQSSDSLSGIGYGVSFFGSSLSTYYISFGFSNIIASGIIEEKFIFEMCIMSSKIGIVYFCLKQVVITAVYTCIYRIYTLKMYK